MDRAYTGILGKILSVVRDNDTGKVSTSLVLVNGKMHTHIVFNGWIHSDVIGHKVRYTKTHEEDEGIVLLKERLVDLETRREYVTFSEL
jgi:hypothetical protein